MFSVKSDCYYCSSIGLEVCDFVALRGMFICL